MSPRKLRELVGATDAYVAAGMGLGVRSFQRLESTPLWAWTVDQLQRHLSACGQKVKIIAVDGHGVEREVT
jgi:hypothetical protein